MPTRLPNGGTQLTTPDVQSLLNTPDVQSARLAFMQFSQQYPPSTPLSPGLQRQKQQLLGDLKDAVSTATAGTPYAVVQPSSIIRDFLIPAALIVGGGLVGGELGGLLGPASGDLAPGLVDTATVGAGSAAGAGGGDLLASTLPSSNPSDAGTTGNYTAPGESAPGVHPAVTGPGTTLGLPTGDYALGGADILAHTLASAFAPTPYPPRTSFSGTTADPVQYMTELKSKLDDVFTHAVGNLNTPARQLVDFSKAQPQPLGTGQFAPSATSAPTRLPFNGAGPGPIPVGSGQTPAAAANSGSGTQGRAAATVLMHALGGG